MLLRFFNPKNLPIPWLAWTTSSFCLKFSNESKSFSKSSEVDEESLKTGSRGLSKDLTGKSIFFDSVINLLISSNELKISAGFKIGLLISPKNSSYLLFINFQ